MAVAPRIEVNSSDPSQATVQLVNGKVMTIKIVGGCLEVTNEIPSGKLEITTSTKPGTVLIKPVNPGNGK